MKISNSSNSASEMLASISKSMQEVTYGGMSEEEGIQAINSAISYAISEGMMSPQDVFSISQEALQKDKEPETQSYTIQLSTSRAAEEAASQPMTNERGNIQGNFMAKVNEEAKWAAPGMGNAKQVKELTPILEEISEELAELNEEKLKIALEEKAQKLQKEKENTLEEATENAKNISSEQQDSSNNDNSSKDNAKPVDSDNNGDSDGSDAGNAESYEATITTGSADSGSSEPTLTTESADKVEPVLTTGSSTSSSSEAVISSDGFENVEVSTAKKPDAPSVDLFV